MQQGQLLSRALVPMLMFGAAALGDGTAEVRSKLQALIDERATNDEWEYRRDRALELARSTPEGAKALEDIVEANKYAEPYSEKLGRQSGLANSRAANALSLLEKCNAQATGDAATAVPSDSFLQESAGQRADRGREGLRC